MRRVEEPAASQAGLEAPAAEQVQRRRGLRVNGRRAKRQVADVLEDANPLGAGEDHAQQRQRVQMGPLVRVVLDGEQVVPEPVGEARRLKDALGSSASGTRK